MSNFINIPEYILQNIDLNKILNREQQKDKIKSWCKQFELNKSCL